MGRQQSCRRPQVDGSAQSPGLAGGARASAAGLGPWCRGREGRHGAVQAPGGASPQRRDQAGEGSVAERSGPQGGQDASPVPARACGAARPAHAQARTQHQGTGWHGQTLPLRKLALNRPTGDQAGADICDRNADPGGRFVRIVTLALGDRKSACSGQAVVAGSAAWVASAVCAAGARAGAGQDGEHFADGTSLLPGSRSGRWAWIW